jgi:hypothetical protein
VTDFRQDIPDLHNPPRASMPASGRHPSFIFASHAANANAIAICLVMKYVAVTEPTKL